MSVVAFITGFSLSLVLTLILTPLIAIFMKKIGKTGIDIHKKKKIEVPESVGLSIAIAYLASLAFSYFFIEITNEFLFFSILSMLIVLVFVMLLGLIDDFFGFNPILKPVILIVISLPIVFFPGIDPTIILPFTGKSRISSIYIILALLVVSITSNTANMSDTHNGIMAGSLSLVSLTAFITSFIIPLPLDSIFIIRYCSLALLGALLAFLAFNKYPAKVFAGDTGSLFAGGAIGLIAIYGKIEFILIIALLPLIMNSFSILSSIGGFIERKKMKHRPVKVEEGLIIASREPKAPITLTRLIVAGEPKTEKQLIKIIYKTIVLSCSLALITALLIKVTLQ